VSVASAVAWNRFRPFTGRVAARAHDLTLHLMLAPRLGVDSFGLER